jgi:hypothetical protein
MKIMVGPLTGKVITTSGTSSSTNLTAGTKAVMLIARTSDAYVKVGDGTQTVDATGMYIPVGVPIHVSTLNMTAPAIGAIHGPSAANANIHVTEYQGQLR